MIESIFFNPWIWILGLVSLVLLLTTIYLFAKGKGSFDHGATLVGLFTGLFFLMSAVGYFGFILPPYDVSFYQTYRITGEVSQVESAFSGDAGTMSQVFIAKVDGIDLFIKSDDQRFRTVGVGDDVNLVCDKAFNYFQEPYFNCSFGG